MQLKINSVVWNNNDQFNNDLRPHKITFYSGELTCKIIIFNATLWAAVYMIQWHVIVYILNFIWPVFRRPCPSVVEAAVATCQSPAVSFFHPLLAFSGNIVQMKPTYSVKRFIVSEDEENDTQNKTSRLRNYSYKFFPITGYLIFIFLWSHLFSHYFKCHLKRKFYF